MLYGNNVKLGVLPPSNGRIYADGQDSRYSIAGRKAVLILVIPTAAVDSLRNTILFNENGGKENGKMEMYRLRLYS